MGLRLNNIIAHKRKRLIIQQIVLQYGIYLVFMMMIIILSFSNKRFSTISNLTNVLLQVSNYAVLGVGMTMVIMTGGIDVSVGATMVVSASVYVVCVTKLGLNEPLALFVMLLVSALFGVTNGFAIAYLKMPAFLVTLSTQSIGRGLSLVLTGGVSFRNIGKSFVIVGKGNFLGIPTMIWIMAVMYVLGFLLLECTIYGRKLMAIGGNSNAARVSGINVRLLIMTTYLLLGVLSGLAAHMTISRLGSYYASMGGGMEFMVIAAAVIGGTSLSGGSGTILGTLIGTLIIGVINNALNLFNVSADWQDVARGVVIFFAVSFDALRIRLKVAK